jgi:hypothetical protein
VKFKPLDRVHVIPLERTGTVIGVYIGVQHTEYQVRYFDNAEAKTVYFYESELQIDQKP